MFRLLKWVSFLGLITLSVLAFTGQKIAGKTVGEHFLSLLGQPRVKESFKDVRTLVGEALKAVGAELSDEMTDDEKKQLDGLVKKEMEKGTP